MEIMEFSCTNRSTPKPVFLIIFIFLISFGARAQVNCDIGKMDVDQFLAALSTCEEEFMRSAETRSRAIELLDLAVHKNFWKYKNRDYRRISDQTEKDTLSDELDREIYKYKVVQQQQSDVQRPARKEKIQDNLLAILSYGDYLLSKMFLYTGVKEMETTSASEMKLQMHRIEMRMSHIQHVSTMQILMDELVKLHEQGKLLKKYSPHFTEIYEIMRSHLIILESESYELYRSDFSEKRGVKLVSFHLDNDAFMMPGMDNQDREYTGGGEVSVSTDHFKSRWIDPYWLTMLFMDSDSRSAFKRHYHKTDLTYQRLYFGMKAFTPYIRYRDNFTLADTLFKYDRPFGSVLYFGRSQHELGIKGLFRSERMFYVGRIGSYGPRNVQALLHKDVIVTSQKVYGWDNQISSGGRWMGQFGYSADFLFYSNTNDYFSIFKPRSESTINGREADNENDKYWGRMEKKYAGLNFYGSSEFLLGGYITGLGGGLHLSALDFRREAGYNVSSRRRNFYEFGFNWEIGVRYRYVIHNSMLEGFGYTNTYAADEFDDEAETFYSLNSNEINRNMYFLETKIRFRWRKMTFFYDLVVQRKEYQLKPTNYSDHIGLVNMEDEKYYNDVVVKERESFDDKKWYGFGKIGFCWIVD